MSKRAAAQLAQIHRDIDRQNQEGRYEIKAVFTNRIYRIGRRDWLEDARLLASLFCHAHWVWVTDTTSGATVYSRLSKAT